MATYTLNVSGQAEFQKRFSDFVAHGLSSIQGSEASRLAGDAHTVYRDDAPYSAFTVSVHFRDTFTHSSSAGTLDWSAEVDTDNPDLRQWLQEGTGLYGPEHHRIYAHGDAMGPVFNWSPLFPSSATFASGSRTGLQWHSGGGGAGPFFWRSIAGMRPNPWEDVAFQEASPLADAAAARIGDRAANFLTGATTT